MKPYYESDAVTVLAADCLAALPDLEDASVDAVVTDPPYGLGFMGREWDSFGGVQRAGIRGGDGLKGILPGYGRGGTSADRVAFRQRGAPLYQAWCEQWAGECLRVLRPGGHMLAFGGTRTAHRLAAGIEDAGFEIRDTIAWLYGSGFPKSRNLDGDWQGWGTALKPANEPIIVARKSPVGTVAANVEAHGVGALNIDGCRTEFTSTADERESKEKNRHGDFGTLHGGNEVYGDYTTLGERDNYDAQGRWPANVLLTHAAGCVQVGERTVSSDSHHPAARPAGGIGNDGHAGQGGLVERSARAERVADWRCEDGCPVAELDAQSGVVQGRVGMTQHSSPTNVYGRRERTEQSSGNLGRSDVGGASRFFPTFRYEPKAPTDERPNVDGVMHPTVKPLDLIRWLTRLVTPPNGLVLDPFLGSGTTAEACVIEGFRCIGIEREPDYLPLILARLSKPIQPDIFGGAA